MEELRVIQETGSIKCNFEEIKADLSNMMSAYTSMEITEDKQKDAKTDLATLRKIRKAVDDKRKDVKKTFLQPYTDFENSVKELIAIIDEPIGMIDGKLKEFDAKRVAEKQEHLKELYNETIGEYGDYLPFEAIKNPKWDNSSYTDKDIKYDISELVTKVRSELDAIKALNSEIENECIKAYKNAGNSLTAAIQKNSDYITAKSLAKAKLEEEKKAEEVKEEVKADVVEQPEEKPFMNLPEEPSFKFKVTGNDNIQKVKEFLDFAEIKYIEV